MKRLLLLALATVIVVLGVRALVRSLASDETKIRWRIESIVEAYNSGDVGDTIYPIAKDWRHDGSLFDREDMRRVLVAEFFQDRDPETKKLARRVEVDTDALVVEIDGDTASAEFEASFSRLIKGEWIPGWRARITADFESGKNGWFVHASRHINLDNTPLSR
jgi:hypothetical protein